MISCDELGLSDSDSSVDELGLSCSSSDSGLSDSDSNVDELGLSCSSSDSAPEEICPSDQQPVHPENVYARMPKPRSSAQLMLGKHFNLPFLD